MTTDTISLNEIKALKAEGATVKGNPRTLHADKIEQRNKERESKKTESMIESLRAETQKAIQSMMAMNTQQIESILRTIATSNVAQAEALERAISALKAPQRPLPTEFKVVRDKHGKLLSVKPVYEGELS